MTTSHRITTIAAAVLALPLPARPPPRPRSPDAAVATATSPAPATVYSRQDKSIIPVSSRSTIRRREQRSRRSFGSRHRRAALTGATRQSALPAGSRSRWSPSAVRLSSHSDAVAAPSRRRRNGPNAVPPPDPGSHCNP